MAKKFFQFNIFAQCKRYQIPAWQCPEFLFFIMGIIIIISSISFYAIGERYVSDPRIVALIVMIVSMTLLVIAFTITRSFEDLAEANRMKAEFVNIVSHQLRAPLTNLRWATQFLLSEDFSTVAKKLSTGKESEYFDIIKENSYRMEQLIDDLLTITRLKDGRTNSKRTKFSLAGITKGTMEECRAIASASNLSIELNEDKNAPLVFSSYPLIKIVVDNLLGNAINYSNGGGKIAIKIKSLPKKVQFEITDEGIGIPAEDRKYIFEKFFRAKNAVKAEVYGTGLGLFIAKLIIDQMKGRIWFKSQQDKGTTFYFTLPIN
ncbi:HAMP domain-containing histidine kinase [Patescibacteria group bacterium]|nr:HAMP domain-containing histidine kinase [Patescibacteria group bacterium]MBU4162307.1 HAMP domain-containing histidine kinase [Patescibacteria group bacterium]